jgi:DNA gyrase subunit A
MEAVKNATDRAKASVGVHRNLLQKGQRDMYAGLKDFLDLGEVIDASVAYIDDDQITVEGLLEYVKGPDFPLGGVAYNQADIIHAYTTGRGPVTCRGQAEIVEMKNGSFQIIITSIPYQVNKTSLIEKIATLHQEKKLSEIKGLRDESTKEMRIAIDLKSGANPQKTLNYIYKHTELESRINHNRQRFRTLASQFDWPQHHRQLH